jgi:hypothetical protein
MKPKSLISIFVLIAISNSQALSIQQKLVAFSKNLLQSSLVLMEEAIPAPHTLVDKNVETSHNLIGTNVEEGVESDQSRAKFLFSRKDQPQTTLTIVQDFPKKANDGSSRINFVQGQAKEGNIKITDDDSQKTTLTIVQDFRKQRSSDLAPIEMVHTKE